MSKKSRIAERHRRTRSDHSRETAEDYVEAVGDVTSEKGQCRVVDLAERFDVSHVTVTKTIARLKRDGLVDTEPYGPISLTTKGQRLAAKTRRRHQIVYDFLRAIGVSSPVAAVDTEGIEHHVSAETLQRFREVTKKLGKGEP